MAVKWLTILASALLAVACAGPEKVVKAPPERQVVELRAESFDFTPDVIRAHRGELVLNVENSAGMHHNLTIKDPGGKVLVNRELPAKNKVSITVPLAEAGEYVFYCDLPMHPTLGMKGKLVVE